MAGDGAGLGAGLGRVKEQKGPDISRLDQWELGGHLGGEGFRDDPRSPFQATTPSPGTRPQRPANNPPLVQHPHSLPPGRRTAAWVWKGSKELCQLPLARGKKHLG